MTSSSSFRELIGLAVLLSSLATGPLVAQDLRQKVIPPVPGLEISSVIDPGSGFFGVPLGATEDRTTDLLGRPSGYFQLVDGLSLMVYGSKTAFLFQNQKLVGIVVRDDLFPYDLKRVAVPHPLDRLTWRMTNGIRPDTDLVAVKRILGRPDLHLTADQVLRLEGGRCQVFLSFARLLRHGSGEPIETVDDADFTVCAVVVVASDLADSIGARPLVP